ncbi:MAG: SRPBCC domain-containing protein [Phycisphaerales bacterium]|nr:SRPBCC domain-containing protein [Phycisphaerales bacterium]
MTTTAGEAVRTLHIVRERLIDAPLHAVWEALLDELGPEGTMPDGKPFPMVFEPVVGGRWFRDLGSGAGHFWGHVQVIKPPALLEVCGPMFMSYAAANHVQYRLTAEGSKVRLTLTHSAMGLIPDDHAEGVHEGWDHCLSRIAELAARRR